MITSSVISFATESTSSCFGFFLKGAYLKIRPFADKYVKTGWKELQ